MNERVKELRKTLGLTLDKFGERLGVTKQTVSRIENGINNVTDQMFKSICREFNVNENWLRTGEGEMFVPASTFNLDEFVKSKGASDLELEIVKAYFELDEDVRDTIIEHFKNKFSKTAAGSSSGSSSAPAKSDKPIPLRAAHMNPGATKEQIEADDAMMESDDF
nr:MAG TPA: helix-turn-helix domain protein [Caudoviricetes sp.]